MIKQFRDINPKNLILLILVAIFLRVSLFIQHSEKLNFKFSDSFASLQLFSLLKNHMSLSANLFIALFCTIIQALLVNKVVNNYTVITKLTFFPALLFITFSSLFPQFLVLSPTLISNFLLIWMISKLLSIHQDKDKVHFILFDIGMIVGLGTLIYSPFIGMFPILWVTLLILRPFVWREWLMGVVGFLIIMFFLAMFYYWTDAVDQFKQLWSPITRPIIATDFYNCFRDYVPLLPVAVILLLGSIQLKNTFFRSSIQSRQFFQLFLIMFLFAIAAVCLKSNFQIHHFLLCVPMASIPAAYFFLNEKRRWLSESLYLTLIACILLVQLELI